MFQNYKLFWINALNIKDRSRRKEYWYPFLMTIIISFIASILNYILPIPNILSEIIYWIFNIATIVASFTVMVRRFHDIGMSMLLPLIFYISPIIGFILVSINPEAVSSLEGSLVLVIVNVLYLIFSLIVLAICCTYGHKDKNKYSINPKTI
ncbi:DUF805 domain-containing protein [Mammaliicoccus vitulinus]|uniref:DUF805 domain-containing protein n=2 Tax=Mammaliicoccus vitulinus TaxID=71237 RepID=A0ABX7HJU5_9STAP|nr:DUF805 domain-containing protein [Mammaliicoccus vitulinus]PNZ33914.1 DUF805 domain-containing protein [Mammaliicoccus vitulinus]QRO86329.1 DUF805 domain-containing protein [Mammaliicoccus vitulinus]QTN12686.1 DUF805 domain-containing protein [Mammaliicoccus vitulinus]